MRLQHKLSRIFFSAMATILLVLFVVVYWYSVPLINDEVYQSERNASHLALNNVYDLANQMDLSLKAYRQEAVAGHKRNLISVIDLAVAYIESTMQHNEHLSREEALALVFQGLRNFSYGNGDYIWLANAKSKILSHPDPKYHGLDGSTVTDTQGKVVIPNIIRSVANNGDGFHRYAWQRLNGQGNGEKLSYVRYLPQWDFYIGTGVYIDEIEDEVQLRRGQAINELRQTIEKIVIAKTGYLFIFDQQGNMLVHPNANINETNALSLNDPETNQSILQELIDVADTGQELVYKWDRPSDPNNYRYEKLSLVRHLSSLGWYICSSVYVDELHRSGELLSQRILMIGMIALFFAFLLAFVFSKWITRPISQLARVAIQVSQGDLTLTSGISRNDELGILASAFDNMVSQLRENIATLDSKVETRTQALAKRTQQLNQVQRMNAVGQLAGGLAHDFNNILTIILGNLMVLKQGASDNPQLIKRLAPAIKASRRGSDITNRLLAFSRRQSLSPTEVCVSELVDETIELLKNSLPSSVILSSNYCSVDQYIYVDQSQLENTLINLVLNAKDAMPNGGDITINITSIIVEDGIKLDEEVAPNHYIQFEIVDDGNGFSEQALIAAFEPFFTTKDVGQGSGLGLSMVFGFIKQSQGYIKLANQPNGGARIVLLLPQITPQSKATEIKSPREVEGRGDFEHQLILLVEDNNDVRLLVREQLVSFGFRVIEAVDSDEAQQLISAIDNLYAMVTDVSMPGDKNGFELAKILNIQSPITKVVLMSGYAYDENPANEIGGELTFIRKPFDSEELRQALEKN